MENASEAGGVAAGEPLIETTRGGRVESVHYGAIAAVDALGRSRWSVGDQHLMTFPRSSLKPLQLLALVAGGGVERFGLQPDELAVMAGSHGGEPMHVERVLRVLQKIEASPSMLACGVQTPLDSAAAAELTRTASAPTAVHNNCSGKHAGMLALARLLGAPFENYVDPDHPAQVAIRACLVDLLQVDGAELGVGMDGCSAPAYALPLHKMARGFAVLGDSAAAPERWRAGLEAIGSAMRAHPQLVAGSRGRVDTELMRLGRGLVAKSGAEGYFCVGNADGTGLALKILDGDPAARARNLAIVMAVRRAGWIDDADLAGPLSSFGPRLPMRNLAGRSTGEIRPAAALAPVGPGERSRPGSPARYSRIVAVFSQKEIAYLGSQRLGRLSTVGRHGAPHNVPVGYHYNSALDAIEIGGHALDRTRKFRDVQHEPRVAFVVDDLASVDPWIARGIEIRGTAEALSYGGEVLGPRFGPEMIRIYPRRVISWGIDAGSPSAAEERDRT